MRWSRVFLCAFPIVAFLACFVAPPASAEPVGETLAGDWTFTLPSGQAGWISVGQSDEGDPAVSMLVDVGPIKPLNGVEVKEGKIHVPLKPRRKSGEVLSQHAATLWAGEKGKLVGEFVTTYPDERVEKEAFTAKAIPPMPPAPDLSKVKWGEPLTLFNGKNLDGWKLRRPEKVNGWSAENGELINTTPKTDFSAIGDYGNLMTEDVFGDFKLHIEFNVGKDRNSGVYLRGMYEAQVVDRDSKMQGIAGVGSVFGRVERSENAAKPGGEWQTYELTLVDRHITVVLNGVTVVDNQPVPGPTGGAMHTDPMAPGPIYLQGDHTSVRYRNIVLTPVAE